MNQKTIIQLDQLNQQFYQKHALSFDQTRQSAWQGWKLLLPDLKNLQKSERVISVLDIGCGNARFAEFLFENKIKFGYVGVDNNHYLLKQAEENLTNLGIKFQLKKLNLVTALLEKNLVNNLNQKFDLVVVFGILHHIPGFALRKNFIKQLAGLLKNQVSLLITTAWQFTQEPSFKNKTINTDQFKFNQELEENDYLLNWQNDNITPRYCHFANRAEIEKINQELNNISLKTTFFADGKTKNLNLYGIWKKIN